MMATAFALPTSEPAAPAQQTFARESDRRRLTPTALKALVRLARFWSLSHEQAAALLGVSRTTWVRIVSGRWTGPLSQDQFVRASALIGIYKGLNLLFADDLAERWPKLPNRGPLFLNLSPVDAMIEGGIPLMIEVRRHVDALRGGL